MSDEPTLDAFAGDADGGGDTDAKRADSDASDATETADIDPLVVTSAYRPDSECVSCGAASARLWVDSGSEAGGVCAACAGWEGPGGRGADQ